MLALISFKFQVWFVQASTGLVHSDVSSKKIATFPLVPVQQDLCDCIAVPLLQLGNFMGYPTRRKFAVTQNVVQNVEHSFVTYSNFRCLLTRSPSAISLLKGSKELHCVVLHAGSSCTEAVLKASLPSRNALTPSCHCAILQCCIETSFMQSLKTLL